MKWRTINTDTESMTGVALVCDRQDDPNSDHALDGMQLTDYVFGCCPHPHIECWDESMAATLAHLLTDVNAEPCS
jgi:hypothetical protein